VTAADPDPVVYDRRIERLVLPEAAMAISASRIDGAHYR
jgi:hypothetical protein